MYNAFVKKGKNKKWCHENFLSDRNLNSATSVRDQLRSLMIRNGIQLNSTPSTSPIYSLMVKKAIITGYFSQVAHLQKSGNYMIIKDNQTVGIHPSSGYDARPEFIVYHEFILTSRNFVRIVRFL